MWLLEEQFAAQFLPKFISGDAASFTLPKDRVAYLAQQQMLARSAFEEEEVSGIAVIPVVGLLGNDEDYGTTYQEIAQKISAADADDEIESIILAINSPGGLMAGLVPAMQSIARATKPVNALVLEMAASAAYMLASQSNKIYALHNLSEVGSVGVVVNVFDDKAMWEKYGIKSYTFTNSQSPYKRYDVATEEGASILQETLDAAYLEIESMIAEGRKATAGEIRENYGNGKMLFAKQAISSRMIDGIFEKDYFSENATNNKTVEFIEMSEKEIMKCATVQELQAAYPELCEKIVSSAVTAERERVSDWMAFVDVDAPLVATNITEGKTLNVATATKLASRQTSLKTVKELSDENVEALAIPQEVKKESSEDDKNALLATAKAYMK